MDMDIMCGQTQNVQRDYVYGHGCNVWTNGERIERLWTWMQCVDKQRTYRETMDMDIMCGQTENVQRDYGHGYNVWTNRECVEKMYGQTHSV